MGHAEQFTDRAPTASHPRMPRATLSGVTMSYVEARAWLMQGSSTKPHLLLGNGFSMAYDSKRFSYAALADQAEAAGLLPDLAKRLMAAAGNRDFEAALRKMEAAAETIEALADPSFASLTNTLREQIDALREALAQSVAGLHPDRPYDIDETAYVHVRNFLDAHKGIYTVNYDLLTYWALMQELVGLPSRRTDDGFRDSGIADDDTVLWNIYDPFDQNVHYLHGALHLFVSEDGLRKITYSRTSLPLIDQIRAQLASRRYPLYVAEGDSASKLGRIHSSAYLARSLRSLTACGGTLLVYGHSLDPNDDHVFEAVARSRMTRMAVSLYGDPTSADNQEIQSRVGSVALRRQTHSSTRALETAFFDAASVPLWHAKP